MNACVTVETKEVPVIKTPEEERPWGYFQTLEINLKLATTKIIYVKPNKRLSLQCHQYRSEHWIIISGRCIVTIGEEKYDAQKGSEFMINRDVWHRVEALDEEVIIAEVSRGPFTENDIKRIEDDYGRA